MEALVAFKTDRMAYLLPRHVGANGLIIVSQPKFAPLELAADLPMIDPPKDIGKCIESCSRVHDLRDMLSQQRIYTWWMGMNQLDRDAFFQE